MITNGTNAVSDLEYDLLAVLKNKAEAIRAYDTYIQDAQQAESQPCSQLLEKLPRTAECPHQNGTPFGGGMNASARVIAPAHGMRCVASSR
ncbi:hypothetical protein C7B62_24470 [Pleurocapsa sp. CCALA 161]|uniref:hypothetical protein n=1 Tax=Pleurocapsa sp. CCALA 161 TaxID=2107688 RepID=UPI000D064EEF|nr:hypothetical protein [Pleurocapsa sp. CCALA 161]PSB05782.1 hypothetical protein C7B62_24470 [Pleurocapsa sp. CCALA 161]